MVTMNPPALQTMAVAENESDDARPTDLTGYLAILKRRWWLLVLIPLLTAFVGYQSVSLRGTTYTATATLLVTPITGSSGNASDTLTAAALLTRTYSEFVTSPPVLQRVVSDLKLKETPEQLAALITASSETSSQVIRITTKYDSPQLAAQITNTVGEDFIAFITDLQKSGVSQGGQALRDSIEKARNERDSVTAQLATLQATANTPTPEENARIAGLESLRQQYDGTYTSLLDLQQQLNLAQLSTPNSVKIAVRAQVPQGSGRPAHFFYTLAGLLAGLSLTVVGLVLAEQASPRVRTRENLRRVTDLPVLVTVPRIRGKNAIEVVQAPRSPASEAIHSLRTQIWLEARANDTTVLTVTSSGSGDGPSLVAANLAVAFAQAGQRVVLVDGNLRHPLLWKLFKKDAKHPGLAELAAVPALTPQDVLTSGPHSNVQILLAGPVSVIPTERLTSERLDQIVADLRRRADVVIIDAPPLLATSDALLLAASADYAVVVASANRTRTISLQSAIARIEALKTRMLGVVLYDIEQDGASA